MDVGGFAKVLMIKLLCMIRLDPDLTPKVLETSETGENGEIYSGYLRLRGTIDSL